MDAQMLYSIDSVMYRFCNVKMLYSIDSVLYRCCTVKMLYNTGAVLDICSIKQTCNINTRAVSQVFEKTGK